jgi:hypothetical protein
MGYPQRDISMTDVHGQPQYGGLLPAEIWHDTMETLATPPCAKFASAPSMTFVPFSGRFQALGFASYKAPSKHKHHQGGGAGGGNGGTTTGTPTTTPAGGGGTTTGGAGTTTGGAGTTTGGAGTTPPAGGGTAPP